MTTASAVHGWLDYRVFVEHTVTFVWDEPGEVVRTTDGQWARLDGVTVHLNNRMPHIWAGGIRCRKNGEPDKRMGKVGVSVELPDPELWIERAWQEVKNRER